MAPIQSDETYVMPLFTKTCVRAYLGILKLNEMLLSEVVQTFYG